MAVLQASNLVLADNQTETTLTVAPAASATTITVFNIQDFAIGEYVLIGDWGDDDAEIVQLHAATAPTGTTVTLVAAGLARAHTIGDKVRRINYNQVEFSRYTAVAGTATVLTTKAISADDEYTSYNDTVYATGYWRFRYKNSSTTVYSSYSGYFSYEGPASNTVEYMKNEALDIVNEEIGDLVTDEFILNQLNSWQREIQSIRDWNWLLTQGTKAVVVGQLAYDVPTDLKKMHEGSGITQMRIKNYDNMAHLDKRELDDKLVDTTYDSLESDVALIDTTITLVDSTNFNSSGTILIGTDEITYTANDTTTGILSGVTGIDATHTTGDTVWDVNSLSQPLYWALFEDHFYVYPAASSTYSGLVIYIDYYKVLDDLSDDTSVTEIPFYHIAQYYLAWRIEERKGNIGAADRWRQIYENRLSSEIRRDQPTNYYRFTLARTKGGN